MGKAAAKTAVFEGIGEQHFINIIIRFTKA